MRMELRPNPLTGTHHPPPPPPHISPRAALGLDTALDNTYFDPRRSARLGVASRIPHREPASAREARQVCACVCLLG